MYYIAKKIVNWGEKKDYFSSEDKDIIRYGIEVLISQIITFLPIILIGFYIKQPVDVCMIILVFGVLRCTGTGYHAKYLFSCFLLTNIALILCIVTPYMFDAHSIFIIFILLSFLYEKTKLMLEKSNKITLKQKINLAVLSLICGLSISGCVNGLISVNFTSIQYATIIACFFQKN